MESSQSSLSSVEVPEAYIEPHYKESYRLAIFALLCGGREAYEEYVRAEQISHLLSEQEILFILEKAEKPVMEDDSEGIDKVTNPSTYFPLESDEEVPDLELGWPEVDLRGVETNISLLYHPPRQNTPTIKEVVRKQILAARQVIAIAMDVFTDVDIFKGIISAVQRGVAVYILLDESRFSSFLHMAHSLGINVQDTKNLCVRTVRGQHYQCRSGMKFHGGLEQRFILVDSQTVLYGTYSYTWSFEKINLSMVLVVTGLLVSSYDDEFRRLYARSVVPVVFSKTAISGKQENTALTLINLDNSSRLKDLYTRHYSLNHLHLKSREMHSPGVAQNDEATMTRGLSVQEKLHRSHFNDTENLVRGHSYDEDLQKLKSLTRMKMGTKDLGVFAVSRRMSSRLRDSSRQTDRLTQQHLRHKTRYGADHNLIPFNSETSLHKWKIELYMNEDDVPPDALSDASRGTSEKSSQSRHRDLSEYQTQLVRRRSKEIRSKIEEMRQNRLSLQESVNLRQSRESLRSVRSDKTKRMSSMTGLEMKKTVTGFDLNMQNRNNLEISKPKKAEGETGQVFTDGQRSFSHYNIQTVADKETMQEQGLCRTKSDADLDMKRLDSTLKFSHLHSSGIQHSRMMESLIEIPEDKEESNSHVNNFDSVHSVLSAKEKKQKSLQRRLSLRSQNTSEPNQALRTDHSQESTVKQAAKKGQIPGISRSQNSLNGPSETDQHKSPFSRLSPQRLSKRKTTSSADQDQGSRYTLSDEGTSISQTKKERPIHRYELKLKKDLLRVEKLERVPSTLDKQRSSSFSRQDSGNPMFQTQAATDNKLGRFMQRVGNLINKNK
ncbi:protein FAM83B [Kryptolebias marmoratus]|uniref:Protein FAM83B-like n=1 Tax=Kryptolebias marmoratus TaxID=37003 RepID=A0A3Q3AKU3_KRYMA|nr:protein FAM83B [Kryptolebias marmoratus]